MFVYVHMHARIYTNVFLYLITFCVQKTYKSDMHQDPHVVNAVVTLRSNLRLYLLIITALSLAIAATRHTTLDEFITSARRYCYPSCLFVGWLVHSFVR